MNVGIEALFTSALGLQAPWVVEDVKLDKRRIDFEVEDREFKRCFPAPWPGFVQQRRPVGQRSESAAARFSGAQAVATVHRRGRLRVNPQNQGGTRARLPALESPGRSPPHRPEVLGRLDGDR